MNNADAATSTDITDLILIEHDEFRTRFANLCGMRGERDVAAQVVAWRVIGHRRRLLMPSGTTTRFATPSSWPQGSQRAPSPGGRR